MMSHKANPFSDCLTKLILILKPASKLIPMETCYQLLFQTAGCQNNFISLDLASLAIYYSGIYHLSYCFLSYHF